MYIFSFIRSSITSYNRTTCGCRSFFMIAISFLIFVSVVFSLSATGTCAEAGSLCLRKFFICSARGLFRLTDFMALILCVIYINKKLIDHLDLRQKGLTTGIRRSG